MPKKLTTDTVIQRFKDKHGDEYDYSLVQYKSKKDVVKIICKTHGVFEQVAGSHWYGSKCPKCIGRSLSHCDAIERFKDIHGNKYDYSKVKFTDAATKVKIVCKVHGVFEQAPCAHWAGQACPLCAHAKVADSNALSLTDVILKFTEVHGDKYDYTQIQYTNKNQNVTVTCKAHGPFDVRPASHWSGTGCPDCVSDEKQHAALNRFKDVHGNMFDYSLVTYKNNQTKVKIICKTHGVFEQSPNNHQSNKQGCPICGVTGPSSIETKIVNMLEDANIEYKQSDRTCIAPQELDILIPNSNVAIECNGLYWHSELFKDKLYHLNKTRACANQNIQLLHFWEHEINDKFDIISSMILTKVGQTKHKLYARTCYIKVVESKEAMLFQNENHLQGVTGSSTRLGLYHNNTLVALMTFGVPRFNRKYKYELIRFCSIKHHVIVGGASKLFKHFVKHYVSENDMIISYANMRISNGGLYEQLGFKELEASPPSYFYFSNRGIYQRYQTQKHKLSQLLGVDNFDVCLTERENMRNNKFYRVYDCGNLVFEYIT